MQQFMARCLAWMRKLLAPPGPGRHRAHRYRAVPASGRSRPLRRLLVVRAVDPPRLPWDRRRRREERIDGDASARVRPYLLAEEQRQRRRALLLATFGIDDPGPYWIHGMEVA